MRSWKYFAGAAILGAALMLKAGAPLFAIAAGLGLAAVVTWMMRRQNGHGAAR